jgi:riboflavin biosynthesis pyrimidine reductase
VLDALAERGLRHVLCEGGPTLLASALAAGVVDELALSLVPTVVGGGGTRITSGAALGGADGIPLEPRLLVEEAGTLMGLWRVRRP